MKNFLTIILALALAISLAACGGDKPATEPAATPDAPAASESSAAPKAATADLQNPEYTPEQLAVAEKFAAMTDRFQGLADKINADEKLLAVQELVDTMNTVIDAVNEDDALFADPANLTAEVLKSLEEDIVAGNTFLEEIEAMVANYAGKNTITVSVEIVNSTGAEIHGLAMSPTNDKNWGGNLLDAPLANSESGVTQMTFTEDTLVWDLMAVDAEGNVIEFMGLDFSVAPMEGAVLTLAPQDGGYAAFFKQ